MAGSKSDWNEARILKDELRGDGPALGANIYVVLHSSSPGETSTDTGRITQVPALAVARAPGSWTDAVAGGAAPSNAVEFVFLAATGDASDAAHFETYADAGLTQPLRYGTITAPQPVRTNNVLRFPAGTLVFSED